MLSLFTCGLWVIVWGVVSALNGFGPYRSPRCGAAYLIATGRLLWLSLLGVGGRRASGAGGNRSDSRRARTPASPNCATGRRPNRTAGRVAGAGSAYLKSDQVAAEMVSDKRVVVRKQTVGVEVLERLPGNLLMVRGTAEPLVGKVLHCRAVHLTKPVEKKP